MQGRSWLCAGREGTPGLMLHHLQAPDKPDGDDGGVMLHPSPAGTQTCVSTAVRGDSTELPCNYQTSMCCGKKVVMKQNAKLFASGDIALFLLRRSDKYLLSLQAEVKMLSVPSLSLV